MLYVKLTKALYGMLRAALLFHKELRGNLELEDIISVISPYYPCVANGMANEFQMTVIW